MCDKSAMYEVQQSATLCDAGVVCRWKLS